MKHRFRTFSKLVLVLGTTPFHCGPYVSIAAERPTTQHSVVRDGGTEPLVQSPTPPRRRPQVVVLMNGSVIQGVADRVEDERLIVTNGPWYSIRVPRRDIDFIAEDFHDAFTTLRSRIRPQDVDGQIKLTHWCLRNDLEGLAGRQLVELYRLAPHNRAVQALETQLRGRVSARREPVAPVTLASHTSPPGSDDAATSDALPALPPDSMKQFTRYIQPLVLNRCGMATCHGSASENGFLLVKGAGGNLHKEFSWKNLRAVLAQVDQQNIEQSPLLINALSVHGTAKTSPFEPHEHLQLQRLIAWIRSVGRHGQAFSDRGDDHSGGAFGTPAATANWSDRFAPSGEAPPSAQSINQTGVATPSAELESLYGGGQRAFRTSSPADPFDPAEFNQRD